MKILGLDLSSNLCGWAVSESTGELIEYGWFQLEAGTIQKKTGQLAEQLQRIFHRETQGHNLILSLEKPRGWHADVLITLARFNGVVHYISKREGIVDVAEYGPEKGKLALSGKGNATKEDQVNAFKSVCPDWLNCHYGELYTYSKGAGKNKVHWLDILPDEADAYGMCLCVAKEMKALYVQSLGTKGICPIKR